MPVVVEFDPAGAVVQAWGVPVTQDVSAFPRFYGETGEYRRHRGVYGEPPTTRPSTTTLPVPRRGGTFVTEKMVVQLTRASGSAFAVALSPDEEQRWLYLADKWMDVDSRGVVYVGETSTGRRVQKFVPRETGW